MDNSDKAKNIGFWVLGGGFVTGIALLAAREQAAREGVSLSKKLGLNRTGGKRKRRR